jgi:hypothetical protein
MVTGFFMNFPYWIVTFLQLSLSFLRRSSSPSPSSSPPSTRQILIGKRRRLNMWGFERFPLWPTLVFAVLCVLAQDRFYPLRYGNLGNLLHLLPLNFDFFSLSLSSHFPMYSNPAPSTFFMYVTDAQDHPLKLLPGTPKKASSPRLLTLSQYPYRFFLPFFRV